MPIINQDPTHSNYTPHELQTILPSLYDKSFIATLLRHIAKKRFHPLPISISVYYFEDGGPAVLELHYPDGLSFSVSPMLVHVPTTSQKHHHNYSEPRLSKIIKQERLLNTI